MSLFESIEQFCGEYSFLSNFHYCDIEYQGITYPSVEHAYVAAKTDDPDLKVWISNIYQPGQAKKYGRAYIKFSEEQKKRWECRRLNVMLDLLRIKFSHEELKIQLLDTYPYGLIEGNWWGDTFWGVCKGEGQNHLGVLLELVREEIWRNNL